MLAALLGEKNLEFTITRIQDIAGPREAAVVARPARPAGSACCRIVWIGILLSVFQQFVGINVIFYYSNILWQAVGLRARAQRSSSPSSRR